MKAVQSEGILVNTRRLERERAREREREREEGLGGRVLPHSLCMCSFGWFYMVTSVMLKGSGKKTFHLA